MSEAHPLFDVLCKSADADCATALERLVREAPDRRLNRINVLDFARRQGLNEQRAITAFLHATQIGLLDMSWNVLCPSCGGVLDANATLKTVRSKEYYCAFCACSSEATLDDLVEVSFTVSPRVRKIAAHNPDQLPAADIYARFSGVRPSIFRRIWKSCCERSRSRESNCLQEKGQSSPCNCQKVP